jgi:DNA polymerase-3 subunit delta'
MSFANLPEQQQVVGLLQRSLERGRLGHAYLFCGNDLGELEMMARTLAKTLNCLNPRRSSPTGPAVDSCDECAVCRRIDDLSHPDVRVVRPESKSRVITIDQMRDLIQSINLKPAEAQFKIGIIEAADRMNVQAANAFLKTLEEPPGRSILVLLTTAPQRILETILSRCLRLTFSGSGQRFAPENLQWVEAFSEAAAGETRGGLLARYRLLGNLAGQLTRKRDEIEEQLTSRSPLKRYDDVDPKLREKWEDELAAAVEAEYRRQRSELVTALQWWVRDVWLTTIMSATDLFAFPQFAGFSRTVGARLAPEEAMENLRALEQLQRWLGTNAQEALALEVGLLKLKL